MGSRVKYIVTLRLHEIEKHLQSQPDHDRDENAPKPHGADPQRRVPANHGTKEHCDSQNCAELKVNSAPPCEDQHCHGRRKNVNYLRSGYGLQERHSEQQHKRGR